MVKKINYNWRSDSPARQIGDLPKFSSTKEDAPGYVPPKDSGKLKNVSELPGYQPIIGGSVSMPLHGKAFAKAAAIAIPASIPVTWNMHKTVDKWNQGIDTATEYVGDKVIPKVKEVKARVGTRIRSAFGMEPNIPPRA